MQGDFFFLGHVSTGWDERECVFKDNSLRFHAVALGYVSRSLCKRLTSNTRPWEIADCDIVDTRYSPFPDRIWKFDTYFEESKDGSMHEGAKVTGMLHSAIARKIDMKYNSYTNRNIKSCCTANTDGIV